MNISNILNPLLSGDTLISQLSVFPSYDADIINKSESERLIALMDIYNLYIPSQMSIEIYSKLYLATLRSLQKKDTKIAIKQRYENYNCINNKSYQGIIGGSDSFTIIGTSGIGKSSAISRAVNSFIKNDVIKLVNPYADIIPTSEIVDGGQGVNIRAKMPNTTNVTNNTACAITASIKITFS